MHVTWCSFLLSPPLFKGGFIIASVRSSVCYALSTLTIGRNPTKFGVRDFHMSGVCDSTFLAIPLGPRGGFKGQQLYLKSQFQRFLYQTLCLFSKIKEMGFSLCRLGHTPGGGTLGCMGVNFFPKHGRVAYQIEGDGEQNGTQVTCSPYGQTCDLEV